MGRRADLRRGAHDRRPGDAAVLRPRYHLLRADEFDAAKALRIGLAQEVVPPGHQIERAVELGCEIAACAPLALQHTIANARLAVDEGSPAAIAAIPEMSETARATADFREGIASLVERRAAEFKGA